MEKSLSWDLNPTLPASLGYGLFSGVRLVLYPQAELYATTMPGPEAYSLEAVPGPRGPPQVLSQGVQELAQLLGAHSHLLPDQLQVLWGHGASEYGCCGPGNQPPLRVPDPTLPGRTFHPQGHSPRLSLPRHPFREDRTIWSK